MAVTRIKNNQITDSTITAAKIASGTLTGGLFAADITLSSNVTITGNLTVSGASDSISATNTFVNDPLVVFNNGFVGSPSYDIGILVNRNLTATAPYGAVNAALIWRESDKAFSGLMTTETGATTGTINNSGFANLRIGNVTANSLTLTSGTLTASGGITGTPISGSTGHFTVLQGTAFSTANAVISGGSLNATIIGNATAASGWFTTLYGQNFSTGNAVISGGYISALTNATITTATTTTLNAGTATAAVLNATAGNVTTGYFGSLNTANAVITGGSTTGLTNFSATTAHATNFSSGNIQATGSTAGTWSTANVSLYQQLAAGTQSANVYVPFYDKATGNAAAYTNNNILFTPSTGTLYVPNVVTNSGSGGYFPMLVVDNFSSGNIRISGGYISALTNATVTTGSFSTLTAATLNTSAANVNGALFATSLNTANAVITGGSATGLTNFSATTAHATNFSSGNIQATGSTAGTWSTANVSLYQQLTASSVNANLSIPLYDKATGNAASSTGSNFLYNPSTNTLFVGTIATNGGNIGSGGGSTFFTTFYATNFSSGNAQITGGNTTGLTNFSATTGQVTNFSTGNAQITGGAITATTGNFGTATAATLNATAGNITTLQVTNFSTGNAVISGGYISALANATVTTASITNLAATTATATNFASGNVAITGGYINSLANLTATTAQATNFSTGNARITGGYADNFPIGANTAATGAFTTLTASGVTTLTNSTDSTSTGTGALQVTGGVGILGNLWVGGNLYVANIIGRVSSTITVQDPLLYLSSNSATYNYDIGIFSNFVGGPAGVSAHTGFARDYSANQWKLFSNVKPLPGGTVSWADPGLIFDSLKAGDIIAANTTASTSTATGALQVAGGAGIAGNLNAGNVTTSMTTGTVMGNVGNFNNIYGTFYGTVAGGAGSANVSLYQTLTDASVNSSHFVAIYDKATGNAAAFTDAGLTYNPSTGALSATSVTGNHYGTTAQFTNFSTANAVISGGYISALTNATVTTGSITNLTSATAVATNFSTGNAQVTGGSTTGLTNFSATTAQATNFSTGNAQVTGGSTTGLTNFSATTGQVTNFSTGNAVISGGYISALTNATVTTGTFTTLNAATATSTTLNATAGNVTTLSAQNFSTGNAVITGGSISGLTNLAATTLVVTNFSTGNAVISGGYISALTNAAITTATTTTLNATAGNVTTLAAGSVNTANAVISGGYISALTNATITTGSITNLTSTTAVATNFSSGNINFTGTTSGTVSTANVALYEQLTNTTTNATHYINFYDKATGNAAALTNTALNFNPSTGVLAATTFSGSGASLTNLPATAVVGTVTTANVSLYESISASTTNATFYPQLVDKATGNAASFSAAYVTVNPSTNTLSANVFSGAVTATTITASGTVIGSGNIVAGSSTDSTSTTTGALVVVGGTGIAGNVTAGKAATFNSGKTAGMDFIVRGKTDNTLIWARPGASYDQVVIGNSATTSTLVTGAKLIVNTTDSIMLPAGTTAQRPGSTGGTDTAGMFRYNSTINAVEWYTGSAWQTASSQFTTVTDTQFSGDGSTVTFTSVNFAAATTNGLIVSINGVLQIPTLAYSLSGSTITFTEAPASGDVIDVRVLTTTATINSLTSTNGYMGFDVKNDGIYILTGTSSATSYNYYTTSGAFVSNIANVSVASANVATTVDSFDKSLYRSAKYTVQATHSSGYQVSEVLVIHDNTTATRTMYATMDTNANLGVTATTVSGSDVLLQYIAQNASTIVRVKKEYMAI